MPVLSVGGFEPGHRHARLQGDAKAAEGLGAAIRRAPSFICGQVTHAGENMRNCRFPRISRSIDWSGSGIERLIDAGYKLCRDMSSSDLVIRMWYFYSRVVDVAVDMDRILSLESIRVVHEDRPANMVHGLVERRPATPSTAARVTERHETTTRMTLAVSVEFKVRNQDISEPMSSLLTRRIGSSLQAVMRC